MSKNYCERQNGAMNCTCTWHPKISEQMMTEFDPSKPVQTRDGKIARLLPERAKNPSRPLVGLVTNDLGYEFADSWSDDGRHPDEGKSLVNIPESKWMNLYEDPGALRHLNLTTQWLESREESDRDAEWVGEHCETRRMALVEWTASGEFITTKVEK